MLERLVRLVPLVGLMLFAGCSSDELKTEPMELESFKEEVELVELWSQSIGNGVDDRYLRFSPFIIDAFVYAPSYDGEIIAIDKETGKAAWARDTKDSITGGLGGDREQLYYITLTGELVALSRNDGSETWRKSISSEGLSAPQSNGQLVVANTIDGNVHAFHVSSGEKAWQYNSTSPLLSIRGDAVARWADNIVVLGFADGFIRAFDGTNGRPLWQYDAGIKKGRTELERLVDIDGTPLVEDGRVFGIAYQGKVATLDFNSGREIWSKSGSSYTGLSRGFAQIYATTDTDTVTAFNENNGNINWTNEQLKYRSLTTPQTYDEFIIVGDFEGYLHVLSQVDGRLVGREHLDSDGIRSSIIVDDQIIYVYTNGGDLAAMKIAR